MSNKNIVTGQLASITTYDSVTSQIEGVATETVTANTVSGNTVSLGTGNLVLSGNSISTTADTITIDPLGDGNPTGNLVVTANMQVTGTLTYNDVVNATTTDLQWIAANDASTTSLATGAGLAVGPLGAYASFTYNSAANVWQSSLPLVSNGGINANGAVSGATTGSFSGNVTASYFIGNGSQLTGLPANYGNADVATYLASNANIVVTTTGNITTTANISTGKLTVSGTSNLGPVGNVTITGGTPGRALTTNGSGVLTWTTVVDPGTIPAFSVTTNANTIVGTAFVFSGPVWNIETLDTDNSFASNKYTPKLAGWYQITAQLRCYVIGSAAIIENSVIIRKNGSIQVANIDGFGLVNGIATALVYFNGTTDYVEAGISSGVTGTVVTAGTSYFSGYWVRP